MQLKLRYLVESQEAVFQWTEVGPWDQLRAVIVASSTQVISTVNGIRSPWFAVLGAWDQLAEFFSLNPAVELIADDAATAEIQRALERRKQARQAFEKGEIVRLTPEALDDLLQKRNFRRALKKFQVRNLCSLCAMQAAATFSVPGAGKTTEALAYYIVTAQSDDNLLVLAPKNAFSAWDEAVEACLPTGSPKFVRLVGGEHQIARLLATKPRFAIMAYSQLSRDPIPDIVGAALTANPYFVFLDESHRIKHGTAGKAGQAALRLSSLPRRKLILSGTPMPQGYEDLVPQFSFLYPEIAFPNDERIVELVRPAFVRTTKSELGLPKAHEPRIINIEMSEAQSQLNKLLHEDLRTARIQLSKGQKQALRRLKPKVLRLIQLNANPYIAATWENEDLEPTLLASLLSEPCAKLDAACAVARTLICAGEKVLIWTNFRSSIQALMARLTDLSPEFIDGSVDAGDAEDQETREGKIRRFSIDEKCKVLIANPMAAAEGISLHTVCRHAIYLDRTFNAGQYLQSLDRIYRIGMPAGWVPTWHVLMHRGTIDQVVHERLRTKIERMSRVLNDPDLKAMGGEWFELGDDAEITEDIILGASLEDLDAAST